VVLLAAAGRGFGGAFEGGSGRAFEGGSRGAVGGAHGEDV
jgi:hypothetical protein